MKGIIGQSILLFVVTLPCVCFTGWLLDMKHPTEEQFFLLFGGWGLFWYVMMQLAEWAEERKKEAKESLQHQRDVEKLLLQCRANGHLVDDTRLPPSMLRAFERPERQSNEHAASTV